MARELRRLLIEPSRLAVPACGPHRVALQRDEQHYLGRVLRLRPGDAVAVIDGCGGLWTAALLEGGDLEIVGRCGDVQPAAAPPLTLALALPRQEVELVWRMACELGIDRLQPLQGERSVTAGRRDALSRWQAVLREATEQCERLWLPSLAAVQPAAAWLAEAQPESLSLLGTTRKEGLPSLEAMLHRSTSGGTSQPVRLAIGPEGGWSPREEECAAAAGWLPVSLGETILRSTTAAVAAASRLVAWRQLSCASFPGPCP